MIEPPRKPADTPAAPAPSTTRVRADAVLGILSGVFPVALCLSVADSGRDYAHDLALLRVTGAAGTGTMRALDAIAFAPFTMVPIGTTVFRLTMGSAFFAGVAGHLTYRLSRRLYDTLFGERWHCVYIAFIAAMAAVLSVPFVLEGSSAAGGTLGACLALAPLSLLTFGASGDRADAAERETATLRVALLVGLAVFYEPLVGLAAASSVAPFYFGRARRKSPPPQLVLVLGAFGAGALPLVAAVVRTQGSALPRVASVFAEPLGEAGFFGPTTLDAFYRAHVGLVLGGLVVAGVVLSGLRARKAVATAAKNSSPGMLVAALSAIAVVGAFAIMIGAPAHGPRFAPAVLAGFAVALVFAGAALLAIVDFVAVADIPFARASATMIVVLELVLPVRQADEAFTHADARSPLASPLLAVAAYGSLSSGTVIVTHEARALSRILAARESGELRSDVVIAPTFDLGSRLAREALAVEPLLAGVYRDVALGGRPEEFALSELSRVRPLSIAFDPAWDRALARHLLSAGMATVFEAEPRGASDRIQGIDTFAPLRQRLTKELLPAPRDPEKLHVTIKMLRTRAIALGSGGEKAVLSKALDDLRALSREDPIADELTRRIVVAKGPIDVRDLTP